MTADEVGSKDRIQSRDGLVERVFSSALATYDLFSIYIGDRLGLYAALAKRPMGAKELAQDTGTDERYVREWLEHQAVTGLLATDDAESEPSARTYRLIPGHEEVLLARDSVNYLAAFARFAVGTLSIMPQLLDAFRTGSGVPYRDYGPDAREGQADTNRTQFINFLGTDWLPAVTDVHERLQADPPARVADVACGTGWSTIAFARAYPKIRVDGFDSDEASIELARRNIEGERLDDRVAFHVQDASEQPHREKYDLVTVFEAIHDMARPIEALTIMRAMLAPGGVAIVADERTAEKFAAPGDDVERLFYAWSTFFCLPTGREDQPSAATGTVMRAGTLREYAKSAGYRSVDILPIENDFWRFYRLEP
ncbi:MAG: methyltransferase domain-containing protein [Actinomycetota bacterium]